MDGATSRRGRLAAAEYAAAEALTLDELGADALEAIRVAVGASNALLYRYDEQGVVRGLAGSLTAAIPSYARELFLQDPVQHHLLRVDPEDRAVIRLLEMDPDDYRRSLAYNDFYKPHDVHHLLGLWMTSVPYGSPGMTGILFTRASREEDFSEADVRALGRALPSFRAAARRVERAERGDRERRALQGVVTAVAPGARLAIDSAGELLWISPDAEALLGPVLKGKALPPVLRDAALRLAALPARSLADVPPAFQVELRIGARGVTAELRLGRESSGAPIVAATLAVRQAPPRSPLDALVEQHGLTKAERSVLACLGEGLTNREIGARLFISVETVKTHVQRVLQKLDVTSRTHAAVKVVGA